MRGIASRLGVSATALYQHFDSKADILEEVRVHGIKMLHGELASSVHLEDPADRIIALCRGYIIFARTNPWLYKLIAEQEADWDELNDEQREQNRNFRDLREDSHALVHDEVELLPHGLLVSVLQETAEVVVRLVCIQALVQM